MGILQNVERIGNITSSKAVALTTNGKTKGTFGAPYYTYIKQLNNERKLGRAISNENDAHALTWGKLVERRVFDILPIEYHLCSNDTLQHKTIKDWAGTPDCRKPPHIVGDVKSPLTLNSFCGLVEPIYLGIEGMEAMNHIRENHSDGEKFYWQIVSNAIITDSDFGQLITYVPYKSELPFIRELAKEQGGYKHAWIINGEDEYLPHLIDDGYYKNLNIIEFQIPKFDKEFLTERVLAAVPLLIKRPECYTKILL